MWFYQWFRNPRTTQEIKENNLLRTELPDIWDIGPFNPKFRHLPTAWDDFYRARQPGRSWKYHRRTQWKG